MNKRIDIRATVISALFTSLISAGAYLAIPIGPVPLVMQNFFVILTGLLLPPGRALAVVGLYLLLGAIGLPLFAGGTGGIAHLIGPTGGYLISYLPAVWAVAMLKGLLSSGFSGSLEKGTMARGREGGFFSLLSYLLPALVAIVLIYLIGVPWLKLFTGISWLSALSAGMFPFIPGDILKAIAAALIARSLQKRIDDILSGGGAFG